MKPFLFLLITSLFLISCKSELTEIEIDKKVAIIQSTFVGNQSCVECHEAEYDLWKESHHDQAMKIADSTSILGNFNNTHFTSNEVNYSFFKKGGDFYVNTEGPDGNYYDYKITYTFGFTPLQQYIIEFPDGRYQCLLSAWDSNENKWFDIQANVKIAHDEWLHWTGGSMTWNMMCADCHSTNLQKNYDSKKDEYKTTYSEINVSCEACHGPSSAHVEFYQNPDEGKSTPLLAMNKSDSAKKHIDDCARCHSRREQLTPYFDYRGEFLDHYSPNLINSPTWEMDGQIDDEDYVYASFVQSKMYKHGISCRDCHDVHSLKLKKEGNDLCLTCHIPEKYDTISHHFHKEDTEASLCVNCHMTGKVYMGNDFRRDHSFRIPRPDQSKLYGTPNACANCHDDKTNKWASDFIKEKYGPLRIDHFSDHLLAGYFGNKEEFVTLFSSNKYPDIARARAIGEYGNLPLEIEDIRLLIPFLKDSSPIIRKESILALANADNEIINKHIYPLLQDPVRMVRLAAMRYYILQKITIENDSIYNVVNEEYKINLDVNSDFSQGQSHIALYYESKGEIDSAIIAYRRSIEIDNYFNQSRLNLALLLYQKGEFNEAEELYLKVIEQEPDFGYSYYMLGLYYNELNNFEKSMTYLSLACEKEPANFRAFYNYALILQKEGLNKESIQIMDKAIGIFGYNEDLLYIKLIGQLNANLLAQAHSTCLSLIEINPSNRDYQQILTQLSKK